MNNFYYDIGSIWIEDDDGDGGEFSTSEVEAVLLDFYNKRL